MRDANYNLMLAYGSVTDEDMERELDHEDAMLRRGVDRFNRNVVREAERGSSSSVPGGRALISGMALEVAEKILEEITRLESGRVKRKPPELKNLRLLPARDVAVLSLKAVLDTIGIRTSQVSSQRLAFVIGNVIDAEYRVRILQKQNRSLFNGIVKNVLKRSSSQAQMMKELADAAADREGIDPVLGVTEKTRLGIFLCEALVSCGVLSSYTYTRNRRARREYSLTEKVFEICTKTNEMASEMRPYLLPTIIPPMPWVDMNTGGYWSEFRGTRLISRRTGGRDSSFLSAESAAGYLTPVNYLQAVPFRVNRTVLEVVRQMREGNIERAGLPPAELLPFPAKPHDIDDNEEARKAYSKAKREVHTRNAQMKGKILAVEKTLMVATEVEEEEAIYFPKFVDFRGRVYDSPSFVHPQGDDLSKGLLLFANGKPLNQEARRWLAIHTANCYGLDKSPLDERVAWVEQNMDLILEIAGAPLGAQRGHWMDADEPFQFLAACLEWQGYYAEGEEYLSCLPVAMDGSCNGLQHFSALLLDPVGGKATNLTDEERPQDIYTEVLKAAVEILKQKEREGEPLARQWLPLMNRKVVKRPVMTLPYGASKITFGEQIKSDTLDPLVKEGECPFEVPMLAARFLADVVWEAVGGVVVAAQSGMGWLQEVAGIAVEHGQTIRWTTPVGFPVLQEYRDVKTREVRITCMGQRLKLNVPEEMDQQDGKLRKRKMQNAVAPNFVHSMDAAHMLLTVEAARAKTDNTIHLAMVHDSYACHAADAQVLADTLREAFVEMYEHDWLEHFRREVEEQLPEGVELPEPPEFGTLDLGNVLKSKYFFA